MLEKEAEKWLVRNKEVRKAWSQVGKKKVIKKEGVEDLSTHQELKE